MPVAYGLINYLNVFMNPIESLKSLADMSKEYVETKLELGKLKIVSKTAAISSTLLSIVALLLITFLTVGFLSIAVALLLGSWLQNNYIGFAIVGGFYLIIFFIIYKLRVKWIQKPVAKNLINEMLN